MTIKKTKILPGGKTKRLFGKPSGSFKKQNRFVWIKLLQNDSVVSYYPDKKYLLSIFIKPPISCVIRII